MASSEVPVDLDDVEMVEDITASGVTENAVEGGADAEGEEDASGLPEIEPTLPERTPFLQYLTSPIVEVVVIEGDSSTSLHAHEALLAKSPYFAEACSGFTIDGPRQITLNEDTSAVGSVLEYLYNGDYFPKRQDPNNKASTLEYDPSIPRNDDAGSGLLRHAKIYTLSQKLGLPALQSLAHSKVHRTSSTAKGELAYARYVYQTTSPEDTTIRAPVASFWATRSHVLRHEAEAEFRAVCLEFPQFGFDVLNRVLDQKEKGAGSSSSAATAAPTVQVGRKRARVSHA